MLRYVLLRTVVGFAVAAIAAKAQLRIDPPSADISPGNVAIFQISGIPSNAHVSVSISYPAGSKTGWLTATLADNTVTVVAPTDAVNGFNIGSYVAHVNVTVNGFITKSATVILHVTGVGRRFSFVQATQLIQNDTLNVFSGTTTIPLTLVHNDGNGAMDEDKTPFVLQVGSGDTNTHPWLSVDPIDGRTLKVVTMTVDPTGLSPHSEPYVGTVLSYDPTNPDDQTALTVKFTPSGVPGGTSLTSGQPVRFLLGGPTVANGDGGYWIDVPQGSGTLTVAAQASYPINLFVRSGQDVVANGNSVQADAQNVSPSQQPSVTLAGSALQPGRNYIAIGTLDSLGAAGTLTAQVSSAPAPVLTSALDSASSRTALSPGAWASIFGKNLASSARSWRGSEIVGGQLPTRLDDVQVSIDGKAAAISYISSTQVNVQVPQDQNVGTVDVQFTNANGTATLRANLSEFAPALFTSKGPYVAAQHSDYTYVAKAGLLSGVAANPARPGEVILLYASGFGPTNPPTPSGHVVQGPAVLANPVIVRIGNVQADVQWSGVVAAGLWQLNVKVPDSVPDGDNAIEAEVAGQRTQPNVTITVARQ